jgi:glycine betaine/proline transport system substrate-binding protein
MKKTIGIMLLIISLLTLTACAGGDQKEQGQGEAPPKMEKVVFADAGWDSIQFHNAVAQLIVEKGYGYKTEVISGSTPATLQGLKKGDIDVYMEVWTDNIIDEYNEMLAGDVVELSVNFDDNSQGLYVPTYVIKGDKERGIEPMAPDLKSVQDLPKYKDLFADPEVKGKGRIYGSPAGWKVDETLSVKMKTYNLEETFNYFRPGSDTALATSIKSAYEKGEPWVGYYWDPTWITGKYDLTLLEEPEYTKERWENGFASAFPANRVTIAVHKDLNEQAPEIAAFLSNYKTSSALTAEALAYMQDNEATAIDTAKWFLNNNQDVWSSWVPEDIAAKVKTGIQ